MEYCYAVCLSSGIIKFGRTVDLHARLSSHVNGAAASGILCLCALVSGSNDSVSDERRMLHVAKDRLQPHDHGNEYFKGSPEDAVSVMVAAGLLPVPTYQDKDSQAGGLRFVVARVGGNFNEYKIVKAKEPKVKDVISVIRKEPLSIGVIKNRCRNTKPEMVEEEVKRLLSCGDIVETTNTHPINQRVTRFYALA